MSPPPISAYQTPVPPVSHTHGQPGTAVAASGAGDAGEEEVSAAYAYTAKGLNELSVSPGDKFAVLRRHSDGWLEVARTKDGARGFVPANHMA